MKKKTIKDSEILKEEIKKIDEESIVYGANGHYAIGACYDLAEENAAYSGKLDDVSKTKAAKDFLNF